MMQSIDFSELDITESSLIQLLGYKQSAPPAYLPETIAGLLRAAPGHCCPAYRYRIYEGSAGRDSIRVGTTVFQCGKIISATQKGALRFAVFTATAGTLFQQWQESRAIASDPMTGYLVDCIGTRIAEATADRMQNDLEKACLMQGLTITNRYSPGYCGWDVTEQQALFSLLPENPCGIRLNASGLMIPVKSVSGVIGIGATVRKKDYGCRLCRLAGCFLRK